MKGDVTDREDIEKFLELGCSRFGKVYGLVNNAGIRQRKNFFDLTRDDWDKVVANNLTSCFDTIQVFGWHMAKKGCGSIVNISSIVGPCGVFPEGSF